MGRMTMWAWPWLGVLAAALHAGAVIGFGAALEGYSQVLHPAALLGARGFPHAGAFNLLAFVLPGLLMAAVALRLRARLPATTGWSGRIGGQLVLLAALGFALQGLLPLDPDDLDNAASGLHAVAWMLWWVAFVPGALALASAWKRAGARGLARFTTVLALLLLALVLVGVELLPPGAAQRLASGLWLLWGTLAAWRSGRVRAA